MSEDPRRARRPARYRDDALLPQHFLDPATGEWVAAVVDWTPEGEMFRTEGARFRDYVAPRAMAQTRRAAQSEAAR